MAAWLPCLADRYRGLAYFDGIRIETDRITYPLPDRVLPVLEEEQVQMCRLMLRPGGPIETAKEGGICLDLGTGSGVLAIAAARAGGRIIAVDRNPRAIYYAKHNASTNGVAVRQRVSVADALAAEPEPGEIVLVRQLVDSEIAAQLEGGFEMVLLSPPYNPTLPGIEPALHAKAGETGQAQFHQQLELAHRMLAAGGWCVGNQMSYDLTNEEVNALTRLQSTFGRGALVRFAHLLEDVEAIQASDFLSRQYVDVRRSIDDQSCVDTFLEKHGDGFFSLLYYEVQVGDEDDTQGVIEITDVDRPGGITWLDRVALHREIVNNASSSERLRAPAFFVDSSSTPRLPPRSVELDAPWTGSVLRAVHGWMLENSVAGHAGEPFELVVLDTAPFYRFERDDLLQECAAWAGPGEAEFCRKVVEQWQRHTLSMQDTKRGLFLHPAFTGLVEQGKWREVITSVAGTQDQAIPQDAPDDFISHYLAPIQGRFAQLESDAVSIESSQEEDGLVGYSTKRLRDLVKEDVSGAEEEILANREGTDLSEDLVLRHWAMHFSLDKGIAMRSGAEDSFTSVLMSLPIAIGYTPEATARSVPETYRGGIWIYARTSQTIGPRHLGILTDLGRLAWLLYNAKYSYDATQAALRKAFGPGASLINGFLALREASRAKGQAIETWIHGAAEALSTVRDGSGSTEQVEQATMAANCLGDILDWFEGDKDRFDIGSFKNVFITYQTRHDEYADSFVGPISSRVLQRACFWVNFSFEIDGDNLCLPQSPGVVSLFYIMQFLWEWRMNLTEIDTAARNAPTVVVSSEGTSVYRMSVPMQDARGFKLSFVSQQGGTTCNALRELTVCRPAGALEAAGRRGLSEPLSWKPPARVLRGARHQDGVVVEPDFNDSGVDLTWRADGPF